MKYRPEVDGLRSVAVLSVIFYHYELLYMPGGFLGVDIFFVISGYLISGILFNEIADTGKLSFSSFWLRRARRILPALLVALAVTTIAAQFLLAGTSLLPAYSQSLLAAVFSASNFFFYSLSGYFDAAAINKPLLHTWSLAVEEQFYLLFPLLLHFFMVRKNAGRGAMLAGLAVCAALSAAAYAVLLNRAADFAFFMLPTRLWELLAGSMLAYAMKEKMLPAPSRPWRHFLEILAGAVIAWRLTAGQAGDILNMLIVPATALFLFSGKGVASRLMAQKPFVYTGRISYSLYLWHWPIFVLASLYYMDLTMPQKTALFLLSFFCAHLSWRFVEQPFRKGGVSWRYVLARLAPAGLCLCGLGVAGMLAAQTPAAIIPPKERLPGIISNAAEVDKDNVLHIGPGNKLDFFVFGDSHAGNVQSVITSLAEEYQSGGAIVSAVGVFINPEYQGTRENQAKVDLSRSINNFIIRNKVKKLLLVCRWNSYALGKELKDGWSLSYRGVPLEKTERVFADVVKESLSAWLDAGITVFILEQVPEHPYPSMERAALMRSSSPAARHEKNCEVLRRVVKDINHPQLHLLRTDAPFRRGDDFIFIKDGKMLYEDNNHLNAFGVSMLKDVLRPFFERTVDLDRPSALKAD